jgi:hypothetical protein
VWWWLRVQGKQVHLTIAKDETALLQARVLCGVLFYFYIKAPRPLLVVVVLVVVLGVLVAAGSAADRVEPP